MKIPALLGVLLMCLPASAQEAEGRFLAKSSHTEVAYVVGYKYLLTLPQGYASDPVKKWPLLVFLHGAGERGDDLELLKKHGPLKMIGAGKTFEAIVVAPQVPLNSRWDPHGVKGLVDDIRQHYRVDDSRLYLTGISMGGFGTWETLVEYPKVFAAAVPICGGPGIGVLKFDQIRTLPIWAFHGEADQVVPVELSKMAVTWMKKVGGNLRFTSYPGVGHDSWTQTYENQAMWDWLFAQRKAP